MIVKYKMVQFIFLLVIHTFILAQISVGGDAELRFGESKNNYNIILIFFVVLFSFLNVHGS